MGAFESKNKNPNTVGKRQTVPIGVADPRLKPGKKGQTYARQGAEIQEIGLDGKSLIGGGRTLNNPAGRSSPAPKPPTPFPVIIPPSDNKPPKEYPGGSGPVIIVPTDPTNVSAEWINNDLVISFDWDYANDVNYTVSQFIVQLTSGGVTKRSQSNIFKPNTTQTRQTVTVTKSIITSMFNVFKTSFSEICVLTADPLNNISNTICASTIPTYVLDLPVPVITVTSINNGYKVDYTTPTQDVFDGLELVEYESEDLVEPTGVTYIRSFFDTLNPAVVISPNFNTRWVKARFSSDGGIYTAFSAAQPVTPATSVPIDLTPPNEVTAVTGTWSGDSLIINYTLPASDAGTRYQVRLTAPNASVGYFYFFPDGTSSLTQSAIITKTDLFNQFGTHYSSFTGLFKSVDSSDNRSPGVSFTVGLRPNPLATVVPTFTATGVTNGYTVSYTLAQYAVRAEVYQKYTSWSGITNAIDLFTGTRTSGGTSGTNTVTLSNVKDNFNNAVTTIPTGYIVEGTGIPANTYITNVSGNQITLSNNFTENSSGTIEGYALVYSGNSPANMPSTLYQNTYIIIKYYDDFDNSSLMSSEQIVLPLPATVVDILGPPDILSAGSSTTAGIDTSGTLGFNGYVNISFNAVTDTSLRGYRIRFTTDTSSPNYSYVDYPIDQEDPPTGLLTYKLAGLSVGATYKIAVATYDQFNNTSSNYVSLADATVSGTPAITDYITAGGFQFGQGVDPTNLSDTGLETKRGIFLDDSNYWFLNASDSARLKVGGNDNNYLRWNGAKLEIDGDITAKGGSFAGNVALTTTGASIYNGTLDPLTGALSGDGFIFNKDGLLIKEGDNQVSLDTATGGITANNGAIANWKISTDVIQNNISGSSNKYVGLNSSPTATYSIWAGSSSAGGDANKFAVTPEGKLYATDVVISGGSLDVGATSPRSTTMTGTNGASSITVASATGITVGMYAVGDHIPNFTTVTSIASAPSITLSTAITSSIAAGTPVRFIPASGAHITSDGRLFAADAILNGKITAQSGSFTGNVLLGTAGSLYAPLTAGTIPAVTGTTDPSNNGTRTVVSPGASNITGIIANKNGFAAYNSTGGYAEMLTTPLSDGSVFATTAANIGGWQVNGSQIRKTSAGSRGNIVLDSDEGYIYVGSADILTYTAGINSADTDSSVAFWAGSAVTNNLPDPSKQTISGIYDNKFVVRMDGKLYANGAEITGSISSTGSLGIMKMDGDLGYISLQPGGSNKGTSYLVPRNDNIYLTSPSTAPPWSSGTVIDSSGPVNGPYLSAGSKFKDYWGNEKKGIGLFVGGWDYFSETTGTLANSASKPFMTATETGVQISANAQVGILVDNGSTASNNKMTPVIPNGTPGILIYTSKQDTEPYSPSTLYGAFAAFTPSKINLSASTSTFININGVVDAGAQSPRIDLVAVGSIWQALTSAGIRTQIDGNIAQTFTSAGIRTQINNDVAQTFTSSGIKTQSTENIWQEFTSTKIRLQSTNAVYQEFDSSTITLRSGLSIAADANKGLYAGFSQIIVDSSGVHITGIPRAATFDMQDYRSGRFVFLNGSFVATNNAYRNSPPMGYPPRQRAVVEDPVTGRAELGFGIYYMDLEKINISEQSIPSDTMGIVGDLAVMF
jgi:hypothetical protein